jgi:hypothetical protein
VPEEKEKEPKFKPDEDAEKYIAKKKSEKKKKE